MNNITLTFQNDSYISTVGREGFVAAEAKTEGDFKTPIGTYPLREVWYRADRIKKIISRLPIKEITPEDCWCDDPHHPLYNQHFTLDNHPPSSFEHLWREDGAYDIIVVIGYNDDPAIPGKGSAIFMHCVHDDGRPTAGCVALAKDKMLELVSSLSSGAQIQISKNNIRFI